MHILKHCDHQRRLTLALGVVAVACLSLHAYQGFDRGGGSISGSGLGRGFGGGLVGIFIIIVSAPFGGLGVTHSYAFLLLTKKKGRRTLSMVNMYSVSGGGGGKQLSW